MTAYIVTCKSNHTTDTARGATRRGAMSRHGMARRGAARYIEQLLYLQITTTRRISAQVWDTDNYYK